MSEPLLSIDSQAYQKHELLALCKEELNRIDLVDWQIHLYQFIQTWLNDEQVVKVKTSGSTGTEKTIALAKQTMRQSAQMTGRYFQLKPGQNALLCLPTHHIAGQMMVVRAFELGLNLITTAPNALSLTELANQTIDFAAMLPLQVHHLVFSAPSQLERISALLIGGAPVSPTLLNALQHIKTAVYQSYGMTETASHIALRRLNSPQPEAYYTVLEEISIDQDERDCLIVHAPSLGIDSLVTQDVVTRHSATEFELLGRCDHVINSGGIKFYPEQLEEKLANVITERRFFIAGEPDEKLGQRLILVIEGKPFHQTELVQLQHRIETRLSRYERPKTIHFLAQFQETSSGKIKRV